MRLLEPRDVPVALDLHRAQNERDRTSYPLPRIFGPNGMLDDNIALALAVERSGTLASAIYFQTRVAEMCLAGCDPQATAQFKREANAVKYTLRMLGMRGLICHVPKSAPPIIGRALIETGFVPKPELVTYFCELDPVISEETT